MKTISCDICSNAIESAVNYVSVDINVTNPLVENKVITYQNYKDNIEGQGGVVQTAHLDLCNDCLTKIKDFIENQKKENDNGKQTDDIQ